MHTMSENAEAMAILSSAVLQGINLENYLKNDGKVDVHALQNLGCQQQEIVWSFLKTWHQAINKVIGNRYHSGLSTDARRNRARLHLLPERLVSGMRTA